MRRLLAAVLFAFSTPAGAEDALQFPSGSSLRIEVMVDGKSPDVAWAAFLDKLFDWFDRDGSGTLSKAEAARVFLLPLADGREAKSDATKEWTKEQFREHYRSAGFTPVALRIAKPTPETMKLGDAVARLLDRNGDGKLSADELKRIPDLLKRCDENEDEVLTAAELLAAVEAKSLPAAGLKLATTKDKSTLRLAIGGRPSLADATGFSLSADGTRLTVPGGMLSISAPARSEAFRGTKDFHLAQFQSIAGNKPAAKAAFEDDPAAQALAGLFDFADRDGDGKLSAKELESFFDLVEAGVNSRVLVEVEDRGRNLFDLIDANADGMLDGAELTRAAKELKIADGIPASFRLAAGRGVPSASFGAVPLGSVAKPKAPAAAKLKRGPRWFVAMDRNGDAFLSAAEFLGTPQLFSKLDSDHDGRVSVNEALAYSGR